MPIKNRFVCYVCNFEATADRVPFAAWQCKRCNTFVGLCNKCVNNLAAWHAAKCQPLSRGEVIHGDQLFRRTDSGGGA